MPGEVPAGVSYKWAARLRELDQSLLSATNAFQAELRRDWSSNTTGSTVRAAPPVPLSAPFTSALHIPQTDAAAYLDYGRLLGKLRLSLDPKIAAVQADLESWRSRDAQRARVELASVDARILAILHGRLAPVTLRISFLGARLAELRALPEARLARFVIRLLGALLLLTVAGALVLAEFALAGEVTSQAMGLNASSARLFAIALCALTLPFKLVADWIEDGDSRRQLPWRVALCVLSALLVGAVGVMRGRTSADLAARLQARKSVGSAMGGATPSPSPSASPSPGAVGSVPSGGQRYDRLEFVVVFILTGLLLPAVGGVALSKARGPSADVVRGTAAAVTILCLVPRLAMARRAEARWHDELARWARARQTATLWLGPSSGLAVFVGFLADALRAKDPGPAYELSVAAAALAEGATVESLQPLRAALAQTRPLWPEQEQRFALDYVSQVVLDALDLADPGRRGEGVAASRAKAIGRMLLQGHEEGLKSAADVFGDLTPEDLYWAETYARFHGDYFGGLRPPPGDGPTGGC